MEPHIPGDGASDRSRAKRKFKHAINKIRQMPIERQSLCQAEYITANHRTEKPGSMREKVFPKIDEVLSADVRQNKRGDHVDTDRLQHDYEEREKGPVGVLAHGEVCPPRLNRNQERNHGPYQSRTIQLHFCPGQYETAQP